MQAPLPKMQLLLATHNIYTCIIILCTPCFAVVTPRLSELSRPKTQHRSYVPDRPSPIWEINPAALITTSTPRLNELARHKTLPPQYQPPRLVRTTYNNYQWPKIICFSKIKPQLLHSFKQLILLADLHAQSASLPYLIFFPIVMHKGFS